MDDYDIWKDSEDTPCSECGMVPCFVLANGKALCDRCVARYLSPTGGVLDETE